MRAPLEMHRLDEEAVFYVGELPAERMMATSGRRPVGSSEKLHTGTPSKT